MYKVKQRVNKLLKPKMRAIADRFGKPRETKEQKAKNRAIRLEEAKKRKEAKAK